MLATAAVLLLAAARPPAALAHATLVRADPPDVCSSLAIPRLPAGDPRCQTGAVLASPPATVRLFFNEPVVPVGRGVRVLAPDGRRADFGPVMTDGLHVTVGVDAREAGTYLVMWRVVSEDTHPARGTFAFSVGHASNPPRTVPGVLSAAGRGTPGLLLQVLARSAHFGGYALGFGTFAFYVIVLRPLGLGAGDPERRAWKLIGAGVLLLVAAEPLALLAQTGSLGEGAGGAFDPEVIGGVLDSSFGRVLAQRLGAALLLWVLLGAVREPSPWTTRAVAIVGLALAFVDGEAAHAMGARPAWLGMAANTLHMAAMGVWTGGTTALLSVWRLPALASCRGQIASRVGRMAATALGVLGVTGGVMAVQHLAGPGDLVTTPYGRTLALKLGMLFIVMLLALGAARISPPHRTGWWARESTALFCVLVLAGLLVSLPPPR